MLLEGGEPRYESSICVWTASSTEVWDRHDPAGRPARERRPLQDPPQRGHNFTAQLLQ